MSTGAVPGPVRRFLAGLADLRAGEAADMEQVGRLLVEPADDEDFFGPLIAQMPAGEPGVHRLSPNAGSGWCWSTSRKG